MHERLLAHLCHVTWKWGFERCDVASWWGASRCWTLLNSEWLRASIQKNSRRLELSISKNTPHGRWGQGPGSVDPRFPAGLSFPVPEILEFVAFRDSGKIFQQFSRDFPGVFPENPRTDPGNSHSFLEFSDLCAIRLHWSPSRHRWLYPGTLPRFLSLRKGFSMSSCDHLLAMSRVLSWQRVGWTSNRSGSSWANVLG